MSGAGPLEAGEGSPGMVPTKLLIGEILITFAIMAPGVWEAAMPGYQPRLGPAWFAEAHESDSVFDRICTARSSAR